MQIDLSETIALLSRTPATINTLLRDLPDMWVKRNEGADTWTAYDVVGHLAYGEKADWLPRVKMVLEHGESQTFVPFNRLGQVEESSGKSLSDSLDEFA